MIPVQRLSLKPATLSVLADRHKSAAKLKAGSKSIEGRWNYFTRRTGTPAQNVAAYDDVRTTLDTMFQDKCCYCEKIITKDIEHFYPKTLYPSRMFDWGNLLRACKDCNFEKLDADPLNPPDSTGQRRFIDPTQDRPEDFIHWNLNDGLPTYVNVGSGIHRGKETVRVCNLDREAYNNQRFSKAGELLYLLLRVAEEDPVREDTRSRLFDVVSSRQSYLGIVRQILLDSDYQPYILAVEHKIPAIIPRFEELRWTHP